MHSRCGRFHINKSLKNIGIGNNLKPSLFKQEKEYGEIYEDTWEDKEHEWLPYLKNDVLSTAFSYARSSKVLEEPTGFGMKKSLILPSLANKHFNSLRNENYEPIYTYNDENMPYFVSQSMKGC